MTNTKRRLLSLTFYRGITVGVAPHPHSNPVRRDPILRYYRECGPNYRGYRGIPTVPITVQTCSKNIHERS